MTIAARALEIEQQALAAWPASEVENRDGWQLRAMSGVSRRANSVWTGAADGSESLESRIAHAESFYAARGLKPCFQVSDHSQPPGLDSVLAARGYQLDAPVSVQVARGVGVARVAVAPGVRVEVSQELTEGWFELSARHGRFATVREVYRGLLDRLGDSALFALAFVDDRAAGVGLAARGRSWLGVSSMFTLPAFRARGAARSILRALAEHAPDPDELSIYLQVERDNAPALSLYHRAGFAHHHAYHYRAMPA